RASARPPRIASAGDVTESRAVVWARGDAFAVLHVIVEGGGRAFHQAAWVTAAHDFAGKLVFDGLSLSRLLHDGSRGRTHEGGWHARRSLSNRTTPRPSRLDHLRLERRSRWFERLPGREGRLPDLSDADRRGPRLLRGPRRHDLRRPALRGARALSERSNPGDGPGSDHG